MQKAQDYIHTAEIRFPAVGLRDPGFAVDILNGASGFYGLQNCDDLVLGESGFGHGDLLQIHSQYAGRSLNLNCPIERNAYSIIN